ncbi:hypothetical protein EJ110_NYTH52207 [Nymphaea thermarum]|nr:hypothetical protein EJ110_NYTH52207 [Nymphaea thermarum]
MSFFMYLSRSKAANNRAVHWFAYVRPVWWYFQTRSGCTLRTNHCRPSPEALISLLLLIHHTSYHKTIMQIEGSHALPLNTNLILETPNKGTNQSFHWPFPNHIAKFFETLLVVNDRPHLTYFGELLVVVNISRGSEMRRHGCHQGPPAWQSVLSYQPSVPTNYFPVEVHGNMSHFHRLQDPVALKKLLLRKSSTLNRGKSILVGLKRAGSGRSERETVRTPLKLGGHCSHGDSAEKREQQKRQWRLRASGGRLAQQQKTQRRISRETERSLSGFGHGRTVEAPPSVAREEDEEEALCLVLSREVVVRGAYCCRTLLWLYCRAHRVLGGTRARGTAAVLGERHLLVPQTGFLGGPCCCSGDLGYLRRLHFRYDCYIFVSLHAVYSMARTRGGSLSARDRGRGPRSTRSRNVETRSTRAETAIENIQQQQAFIMNTLHIITGLMHGQAQNSPSGGTSVDTNGNTNSEARGVTHQQFMSLNPPKFHGKGTADDAEQWIMETEEIFATLEMPDNKKVLYGTFMLKGDVKEWWRTQREMKFANRGATWEEFKEAFTHAYIPTFAREKHMQEFLDLQQRRMSLHEYVVKFRHLEKYCPHVYTTNAGKANKFVRGLKDGLRSQVMASRPRDLDDAIDMATRFEEDGNLMHGTDRRNEFLRSKSSPDTFKRRSSDRVNQGDRFKKHRSSFRQDDECPTCHRQHPGKPCYKEVGACLYCGTRGHFIRECPKKKEAEQGRGAANQPAEKKVPGRVYATTVEDLKSTDVN